MADEAQQKREHFRLEYPVTLRPKYTVQGATFEVLDLSEKGIRFYAKSTAYWIKAKGSIQGELEFADGKKINIEGRVIRVTKDQVIVRLSKGVPLSKIMEEQRLIIKGHGRPSS